MILIDLKKIVNYKLFNFTMKKVICLLIFISCTSLSNAQQNSSASVQEILTLIHAKERTQKVVKAFYDNYKKNQQHIPSEIWNKIESEFDITPFIQNLAAIYKNTYSPTELNNMVKYLKEGKKEEFKNLAKKIEKPLADLAIKLGEDLGNFSKKKLKYYGY